eukprot:6202604-Pleurochrysis_carterae.AAC.1
MHPRTPRSRAGACAHTTHAHTDRACARTMHSRTSCLLLPPRVRRCAWASPNAPAPLPSDATLMLRVRRRRCSANGGGQACHAHASSTHRRNAIMHAHCARCELSTWLAT